MNFYIHAQDIVEFISSPQMIFYVHNLYLVERKTANQGSDSVWVINEAGVLAASILGK